MTPLDAKAHVDRLVAYGLEFMKDGAFVDIAVVDQRRGTTERCDWLQTLVSLKITVARFAGEDMNPISAPPGWTEDRASHIRFAVTDEIGDRVVPMQSGDGLDVMLDTKTGKEVFLGRTPKREE